MLITGSDFLITKLIIYNCNMNSRLNRDPFNWKTSLFLADTTEVDLIPYLKSFKSGPTLPHA